MAGQRLARLADVLEGWLVGLVLAATATGVLVSAPGRAATEHNGINVVLAVLVLAVGLLLTPDSLPGVRTLLPRIGLILVGSTVLLPGLALLAAGLVDDPVLRGGVLAAGVAPAEVASVAIAAMARAEVAVTAVLLVGSTLLCVLAAGPVLAVLAGPMIAAPAAIIATLALVVGVPLATGLLVRARWPRAPALAAGARLLNVVAVTVLVWLVASQVTLSMTYLRVVAALLVYLGGAVVVGVTLGSGLDGARRVAVVLPVAMRDFAVAAGIAVAAFGPRAAAPLSLYGTLVLLFGAVVARRVRRRGQPRSALQR